MSASRPSSPCQVIKDKFISASEGFADTFNWVAETLFNLKAGKGIRIFWADSSHPIIEANGGGTATFKGTDGSEATASTLTFKSAGDSNVVVTCSNENKVVDEDGNENTLEGGSITIGVYYV